MFTTTVYKGKQQAAIGAQIALSHRLYVSGWGLLPLLHKLIRARHRQHHVTVVIGLLNGVPITAAVSEMVTMIFCRKKYRGQGYGSATLNVLKDACDRRDIPAWEGAFGSLSFWNKHGIEVTWYRPK